MQIESVLDDVFGNPHVLRKAAWRYRRARARRHRLSARGLGRRRPCGAGSQPAIARRAAEDHDTAYARRDEWLEIGLGAQILRDLGIASIELLASRERHYVGLEGFGIRISRTALIEYRHATRT